MSSSAPAQFLEAQRLIDSGDYDAATRYCVMLWRENEFRERTLMVFHLLPKLVASHEPARVEFAQLRDSLNSQLHEAPAFVRWIQLCDALDDGEPVVRWLETVDLDTPTTFLATSDERVYRLAERAGAMSSFARIVDLPRIEAKLREGIMRELKEVPSTQPTEFAAMMREPLLKLLEPASRALRAVGRFDDEAKLAALIASLPAELAQNVLESPRFELSGAS